MKVVDFLKKVNAKKPLNSNRVLELKQYYLSMYRYNMVKLYDLGYIDDPTIFKETQIYKNIIDLKIQGMYDLSGKIQLSTEWVSYAYHKNNSTEQQEFLTALYYVLKYREYSSDLDMFYETFNKGISLQLYYQGSKVVTRSNVVPSRGSLMCMIQKGETLSELSIKGSIWILAMKELGIPEEDWYLDGLFDISLTHAEEVAFINILLNGKVLLKGKYSKLLEDWLYSHKWSDSKMTNVRKGLVDYIYVFYSDEVYKAMFDVVNSVPENTLVAIYEDTIYVRKPIQRYYIPVGYFAIESGYEDTLLSDSNAIYGYTGEGYLSNYLDEEGIPYIGVPVKVVHPDMSESYIYDREQVSLKTDTWFKQSNVCFAFDRMQIENPFKEQTSLPHILFDIYVSAQNGNLGYIDISKYNIKEIEQAKVKVARKLKGA